jgi:hypothetical protein
VQDEIANAAKQLYAAHTQLTKPIPESETGLTLDNHVNGAKRSILKSLKPFLARMEKVQDEIANAAQQRIEVATLNTDQLVTNVEQLLETRQQTDQLLRDAEDWLSDIELQGQWVYLVDSIRRLFDSIDLASQFTDVGVLRQRTNDTVEQIQQELATRGTQEYQAIYDEFYDKLNDLRRELDSFTALAKRSIQAQQVDASPSTQQTAIHERLPQLTIEDQVTPAEVESELERLYRNSQMSPEEFLKHLFALQRQQRLVIEIRGELNG